MLKKNKAYISCAGLFFLLLFICFLSTKIIRNNDDMEALLPHPHRPLVSAKSKEDYQDSCCYYEYLQDTINYPDINPFYCKGRRWRYHGFPMKS